MKVWMLVGVSILVATLAAQTFTTINLMGVSPSGAVVVEQVTIISGSTPLPTTVIAAGTCALAATAATSLASSDVIIATFASDPAMVTGYLAGLSVYSFPSQNSVNFEVCNISASAITPGPLTLNWKVFK